MLGPAGALQAQPSGPVVAGYYVHDDPQAQETLAAHGQWLSWVITTSFFIGDGTGALRGRHDADVMRLARQRGASVHFRISNLVRGAFDPTVAHAILTDRGARARAVAEAVATAAAYGYDGVNVDLERVPPADRGALTAFVRELAAALRPRGVALTVAVPGKTGDDLSDPSSGAFDLAALARAADSLVVMAYDEHWDGGPPGPVASLPWVEAVVRYAISRVQPSKILLGVAFYGYDWPARGPGEGISMREAVRRSGQARVAILWDQRASVPFYRVGDRTVYFENAQSLARKLSLRSRYRLAGVAAWRLGHELPDVWDTIGREIGALSDGVRLSSARGHGQERSSQGDQNPTDPLPGPDEERQGGGEAAERQLIRH